MNTKERFESCYIPEPNSGCWLWTRAVGNHGYGVFGLRSSTKLAHRVSLEFYKGPIPVGAHVDHTCRTRCCVNPDHLDVVSQAENNRRIVLYGANRNTQKTHCPNGHPYTGSNLIVRSGGRRGCHACMRMARAKWRHKVKAERIAS